MGDFWKDEPEIALQLKDIGSLMNESIEHSHSFVKELLSAQVNNNGKLLRPALALIGGQLGDPNRLDKVKKIASVVEMIHIASLIHDDIIDNAKTRRNLPTLLATNGPKQAVLAGDFLLSKAMALVAGKEGDLDAAIVSNSFSRLCESELEQDANMGDFFISTSSYTRRIAGKTASLFALSGYAGAAVAKAEKAVQYKMHRIGYLMGMAFQIKDDILDYEGSEERLGKAVGSDLLSGIPTLPLLKALEFEKKLPKTERKLHALISKKRMSRRISNKAHAIVHQLGGVIEAQKISDFYLKRAKDDIRSLNNPKVEKTLFNLFDKLSIRSA